MEKTPGRKKDGPQFELSLLERTMSKFSPKAAQRRYQERLKFEMTAAYGRGIGGYIGARRDRPGTADWNPGGGSPAVDINPDLPMLRDRSRDQMRNAPVALGALTTDVLHVVGTGLSYTPAIDFTRLGITEEAAQEWMQDAKWRFKAWAESPDCDVRRQLDFYSQVELAYRAWKESGDSFVLTPIIQRDGQEMLALQVIEADRICNPRGQQDSQTLQDGVELDAETCAPVAVHVAQNHPGDLRGVNSWTRVEIRGEKTGRRNVLHLMDMLRPGQVRGVPWIAPILEPLKQLNKWSDAELNAAVTTSIWAVFMEMEAEGFADLFDDASASAIVNNAQRWSGKMESGKAVNLLPGEKAHMVTPSRPNPEFDPFWSAMMRQLGMVLNIPVEVLTMHFQSSYTAARGALLMAWRGFYYRRDKVAKLLCQPVLELWLGHEISQGRIAAPGFFADKAIKAAWCAAMWTGDGPGSVDPVKEVTAAKERVAMGISTLQAESILHDGQDWEGKERQRAKEVEIQTRNRTLPTPPAAAAAPPATNEPAKPNDPNGDLGDDDTDLEGQPKAPGRQRDQVPSQK